MKSSEIKALLQQRADRQNCLIAFEVNEGTGSTGGRIADAVSFHLWPSDKYKIIGYEIKVSRSDWLNEMKQPDKSRAISKFCDEWYLVAPKGVLGIDELPKTWGFIEASSSRLSTKIKCPKREVMDCDRPFMASLMRSMIKKYEDKTMLQSLIEAEREKANKDAEERYKHRSKRAEKELSDLMSLIERFHQSTGLYLSEYNLPKVTEAIKALQNKVTIQDQIRAANERIKILQTQLKSEEEAIRQFSLLANNLTAR